MREIKFRAWSVKDKSMTERAWPKMAINSDGTFGFPEDELYTLMQYTGLKDKNGKEIYEGDIVLCGSKRKCPHVVEWFDNVPSTGLGGMPGFYLTNMNEGYVWMGESELGEELVGNIHENPELVK